jgi:hypothetical protein
LAYIQSVLGSDTDPNVTPGRLVKTKSGNIYPSTIVAVASPGTPLPIQYLSDYDWFNVAQTGAATNQIILPSAAPIGTVIKLFAVSAVAVKGGIATSGIGINAGADTTAIALAAGSVGEFQRVSATNWTCLQTVSAGTTTATAPA